MKRCGVAFAMSHVTLKVQLNTSKVVRKPGQGEHSGSSGALSRPEEAVDMDECRASGLEPDFPSVHSILIYSWLWLDSASRSGPP